MTEKSDRQQAIETLIQLVNEIEVAMLTTETQDGQLRSRPMVVAHHEFDGDLWFFTSRNAPKLEEIRDHQQVNVSFASPKRDRYVSLSGVAKQVDDPKKIEILWDPKYKAWCPESIEMKDLCFLKVDVQRAEYWDAARGSMTKVSDFAMSLVGEERSGKTSHETLDWSAEHEANSPA